MITLKSLYLFSIRAELNGHWESITLSGSQEFALVWIFMYLDGYGGRICRLS